MVIYRGVYKILPQLKEENQTNVTSYYRASKFHSENRSWNFNPLTSQPIHWCIYSLATLLHLKKNFHNLPALENFPWLSTPSFALFDISLYGMNFLKFILLKYSWFTMLC